MPSLRNTALRSRKYAPSFCILTKLKLIDNNFLEVTEPISSRVSILGWGWQGGTFCSSALWVSNQTGQSRWTSDGCMEESDEIDLQVMCVGEAQLHVISLSCIVLLPQILQWLPIAYRVSLTSLTWYTKLPVAWLLSTSSLILTTTPIPHPTPGMYLTILLAYVEHFEYFQGAYVFSHSVSPFRNTLPIP